MTENELKYLPPELVKAWELCEKATAGPWVTIGSSSERHPGCGVSSQIGDGTSYRVANTDIDDLDCDAENNNAAFIADARTSLPLALSLVIKMGKEAEEAHKHIGELKYVIGSLEADNSKAFEDYAAQYKKLSAAQSTISAAQEQLYMCDDIKLDQPLAHAISDLQKARATAEATVAELRGALEKIRKRSAGTHHSLAFDVGKMSEAALAERGGK